MPPAEFTFETRMLEPAIAAVTVVGSVDWHNAFRLRDRMTESISGGVVHLVLELDGLDYLDSTGLGVLVGIVKTVRRRDGSLHVVGVSERVEKILRITGLGPVLPTAPSLAATLERIHAPDLPTGQGTGCGPRPDEPG